MIVGLVDTTVVVHLHRRLPSAHQWLVAQQAVLGVTPITWLEAMRGAPGKRGQETTKSILLGFELTHLTAQDQEWAMQQMEALRLSVGVEMNDCLIASVSQRLQVPIFTHNVKDMRKLLPPQLVVQPYDA